MIKLLLPFILWLGLSVAQALTLTDLSARLAAVDNLRAQFTQERQLLGFTKPLRSQGQLLVSKELGIVWQQDSPFYLQLIIDKQGLRQKDGSGQELRIDHDANPQFYQLSALLQALLQGKVDTLQQNFKLDLKEAGASWHLSLVPQDGLMQRIFTRIELEGQQYIDKVSLYDAQDDVSVIYFSKTQALDKLSEAERELFAR